MVDDRLVRYLENPATREAAAIIAASWAHHQDSDRLTKDLDFLEEEVAKRQPPEPEPVDEERLNVFIRKVNAFDSRFAKFTVPILEAAVKGELDYAEDAFARLEEHVKSIQQGSDTPLSVRWRGEFEASVLYKPGDLVTLNGSAFVCVSETSSKPSGISREWDLLSSVISGPAGAAGLPGSQGPQGPQGPPGVVTFQEVDGVPSGTPDTLIFPNGTLTDNLDGSYTYSPAALGSITIEEVDGNPTGTPGTLKFPNGSLTDNGDGSFTYTAPAGGAINVTDGTTTVSPATTVTFGAGMVTNSGGGVATISNDHDDLSNVTTDQHHPEVHTIDGTDHIFPTSGDGSTFLDDTGTFSTPPGGLPPWIISGSGPPYGVLTPDMLGQVYADLGNGALFLAVATGVNDWFCFAGDNEAPGPGYGGTGTLSVVVNSSTYTNWLFRGDGGFQLPGTFPGTPTGLVIYNVPTTPDVSLGSDGDWAVSATGKLYYKSSGTWALQPISHDDLSGVSADDHHAQSHAHNGADSSGTVAHSATTGQTANDHHNQSHSDTDHSDGPNAKPGHAHSSHSSIGADDHHNQNHNLIDTTGHPVSGLTTGTVIRASGATAYAFAQLAHGDLGSVGADDHHAQSHAHSTHSSIGANDHHNQAHKTEHEPGGGDAMTVDAAAATGSLRTLGTASTAAAAGNHTHATPITPVVNVYTANDTWSKPAGCTVVFVTCIGGGGSGGSGRKGTASSDRYGGGGGGGGMVSYARFQASTLGTSESVVVGGASTGASAQTTNSNDGTAGATGNQSSFGSWLLAKGGNAGAKGTATGGATSGAFMGYDGTQINSSSSAGAFLSGNGGHSAVAATASTGGGGYTGGGGGGGGIDSSNNARGGGGSGAGTGGVAVVAGANGTPSNGNSASDGSGGGGGGGGCAQGFLGVNVTAGGTGGEPGGGGGGGGAGVDSVANSGAGGNGAKGRVMVIAW